MGIALKKSSVDLGIVTTNGEAMLKFYRDVLGLKYEREMPMPVGTGVMHRMFCGESLIKLVVLPAAPAKAAPGGIGAATGYRYWTISVTNLDESEVAQGLHSLIERSLAGRIHEPGSRVPKFMHHAEILLGATDARAIAAICVLLLRGAQTSGEIKTRTDRLCDFSSSSEVEELLQELSSRAEPCVVKLPRQPGQKESRYRQLYTAAQPASVPSVVEGAPSVVVRDRVSDLEKRVQALEEAVKRLSSV